MKTARPFNCRAFSFVEIMFAIICLGLLAAPIFKMFGQGAKGTIRNRNDILAQQHASNLMSYVFFLPYNHDFLEVSAPRDTGALQVDFGGKTLELSLEEPQFKRTIAISEIKPPDWQHTYKVVTVVVRWQEPNGLNRRIKIAGLVSK